MPPFRAATDRDACFKYMSFLFADYPPTGRGFDVLVADGTPCSGVVAQPGNPPWVLRFGVESANLLPSRNVGDRIYPDLGRTWSGLMPYVCNAGCVVRR